MSAICWTSQKQYDNVHRPPPNPTTHAHVLKMEAGTNRCRSEAGTDMFMASGGGGLKGVVALGLVGVHCIFFIAIFLVYMSRGLSCQATAQARKLHTSLEAVIAMQTVARMSVSRQGLGRRARILPDTDDGLLLCASRCQSGVMLARDY